MDSENQSQFTEPEMAVVRSAEHLQRLSLSSVDAAQLSGGSFLISPLSALQLPTNHCSTEVPNPFGALILQRNHRLLSMTFPGGAAEVGEEHAAQNGASFTTSCLVQFLSTAVSHISDLQKLQSGFMKERERYPA